MSNGEEGFTITETLTAIGIISVAGMIVLAVLSSSIKGIDTAKDNLDFGMKLLPADDLIRLKAGAVRIPFWERRIGLVEGPSSLQIPWYEGRAGDYLRFFWEDHSLLMESGSGEEKESILLFKTLDRVNINVLSGEDGIPRGLDITYTRNGKDYHTRAAFSSLPIQLGRP
jgi:hypothetical protein